MPVVNQGVREIVTLQVGQPIFVTSTGSAALTYDQELVSSPRTVASDSGEVRIGPFEIQVDVTINPVVGTVTYNYYPTVIQPLNAGSTQLDIAETVNRISDLEKLALYTSRGAAKIGGRINAVGGAYQNKTTQATFVLRSAPARIRFHFLNCGATAVTGLKASLAVSANVASWSVPSGGVGTFTPITVAATIPAATVNAGLDSALPVDVVSDWIVPNCIPRNDGGEGFILMVRKFEDATSAGMRMFVGGTSSTPAAEFSKYEVVTGLASTTGDFTVSTASFTENGAAAPAFWMEVDYETPTATIAIVGDSIMQGSNGDPGVSSAAYGAAFQALQRLSDAGKRCQLFNAGWSGAPTHGTTTLLTSVVSGYLGQFISYVNAGATPTVAAFCPWSVNNANTYLATQLNSVRQSIAVFVSFCNKMGIKPVLVTPAPRNSLVANEEQQRRICVNYIKEFCNDSGVTIIDRDGVYTDYSIDTGGYRFPDWCIDSIHPTAAGHAVESVEWERVLNGLI